MKNKSEEKLINIIDKSITPEIEEEKCYEKIRFKISFESKSNKSKFTYFKRGLGFTFAGLCTILIVISIFSIIAINSGDFASKKESPANNADYIDANDIEIIDDEASLNTNAIYANIIKQEYNFDKVLICLNMLDEGQIYNLLDYYCEDDSLSNILDCFSSYSLIIGTISGNEVLVYTNGVMCLNYNICIDYSVLDVCNEIYLQANNNDCNISIELDDIGMIYYTYINGEKYKIIKK